MEYKIVKKTDTDAQVELTLNKEEWQKDIDAAYNKEKGRYKVNGFMKGKVPRSVLEKSFGDSMFFEEAINMGFFKHYAEFLKKETTIKAYGQPSIQIKSVNKDGLTLELTVPFEPSIELGKYKGLGIKMPELKVSAKEVDDAINQSAEKLARSEEKNGASSLGDEVNIDFVGSVNGVNFAGGEAKGYDLVLGSNTFIPGFEDQLVGTKKGEVKDVKVTFPKEYHSKELAGAEAVFKCTVNSIKAKVLPEINDELAKDASEFDTLAAWKEATKKQLIEAKEAEQKGQLHQKLVDEVIKNSKFKISHEIIHEEMHYAMHDLEHNLKAQNMTMEQYLGYIGKTSEELHDIKHEEAETMIKMRLVFLKIKELEKIEIDQNDIIAAVKARMPKDLTVEAAEKYYSKMGKERQEMFKNEAMVQKIVDFLAKNN